MSSKKKTTRTATTAGLPALRIGSRVRCTDDGVEGRITWANAVAVKIKWDDGEAITWKRDSLASRPIEILAEPEAPPRAVTEPVAVPRPGAAEPLPPAPEQVATPEATTTGPPLPAPAPDAEAAAAATTAPAQPKRERKAKTPAAHKEKKLSALASAAKVLSETGQAMTCKELIGTMAAQGYWSSPGGKTPDATLNAAMIREIAVKGDQSRFVKAAPGRFARRGTV